MKSPAVTRKLSVTSHAILALLTITDELTGNDIKTLADRGIKHFYLSPSTSQVYAELKNLECYGYVESKDVSEPGIRGKRVFTLTASGADEVRRWVNSVDVEPYVLRHGSMLRLWAGAMADPCRLQEIWQEHILHLEAQLAEAEAHAGEARGEPAWTFGHLALRWSVKHYRAELELAQDVLDELDQCIAEVATTPERDARGIPQPSSPRHKRALAEILRRPNSSNA